MDKAAYIFNKIAKMSPSKRNAMEDEMHAFNRSAYTLDKWPKNAKGWAMDLATFGAIGGLLVGRGNIKKRLLAGAGVGLGSGAALSGLSSAYWLKRDKSYLKDIPDASLERGIKGVRRYKKGDKEALNKAYFATHDRQGQLKPEFAKR